MFKVGEYVVYKNDVCSIKDIKNNCLNVKCYVIVPLDDPSLTIDVPVGNKLNNLRPLISKNEIENIIESIPNIPVIEENKQLEAEYKALLSTKKHADLIKIIKTAYLRNKERIDNNKKTGAKDNYYFEKAEKCLYTEFSIVLKLSYDETKNYVVDKVNELENSI